MAVYVAWYDYKTLENTSTTELHWPLGKDHLTLRNENYGVLFFISGTKYCRNFGQIRRNY